MNTEYTKNIDVETCRLRPVTSQCTKWWFPTAAMCVKTVSSNETFGYIGCQGQMSAVSPALVGRNFSSVYILLSFMLCQCNVMTLLNNLNGTAMQTSSWSLCDPCPLPRVLFCVYSSLLVACTPGSWLAPPLVLPNHSTALTTADRGCMDFPSVAVPWSPCSSLFVWPDLQPLVGLPAQHPGAESPLEHHLAQSHFSNSFFLA